MRRSGFRRSRAVRAAGRWTIRRRSLVRRGGYKVGATRFPARPKMELDAPVGRTGLGKGARVKHPKYGEGVIFAREGDGEDAKLTVQFSRCTG